MKEIVEIFKNLNASHWINLFLASLLWFAYTSNEKRIERLETIVQKEQEASRIVFQLYQQCIKEKHKK